MKSVKFIAGACALAATAAANADERVINTNFVQLEYAAGSFKNDSDQSVDTKGYEIEASYAPLDQLLLRGSYATTEEDESGSTSDDEIDTIKLWASWLTPTPEDTVNIDIGIAWRQDDGSAESIDGLGAGFGVAAKANDYIEVFGHFAYLVGDYDGSIDAEIGAAWHFSDLFAATISYENFDQKGDVLPNYKDRQWQLGVRASF